MLKAIVFDYNGVLVDDLAYHRDAYVKAAEELGLPLAPETVWRHISTTPEAKRTLLFENLTDETWATIRRLKDTYYNEMVKNGDIILPDAEGTLRSLSAGYRLALVSNTSRTYFERWFPSRMAGCFLETLFSEEMHHPKPSPEPLLEILAKLSVTPKESCYIGDALSDVEMAKAAGVMMFGITTGHHTEAELRDAGADRIVHTLREFVALVSEIRRS